MLAARMKAELACEGSLLLVQHDPMAADATARLLPRWRTELAAHPDAALRAWNGATYDAAIVDISAESGLSVHGTEVARGLRAASQRARIILVASNHDETLAGRVREIGADVGLERQELTASTLRIALRGARRPVPEALASLPDGVRALLEDALDAAALHERATAEWQSRLVRVATAAHRSGQSTTLLTATAKVLGMSRQTLHARALVGERWPDDELRTILSRKNSRGEPISLSHLELLAHLPRTRRQQWLERVLCDSLSVAELHRQLAPEPPASSGTLPQ